MVDRPVMIDFMCLFIVFSNRWVPSCIPTVPYVMKLMELINIFKFVFEVSCQNFSPFHSQKYVGLAKKKRFSYCFNEEPNTHLSNLEVGMCILS